MALRYPRAVLIAFALLVGVGLFVAASTSGTAYGAYNPSWDGASGFTNIADTTGTDTEILRNSSGYEAVPRNGTLAVVLSPDDRYAPAEAQRLREFVAGGGTLLLAADAHPPGNQVLAQLGTTARIDGRTLRDERNHGPSPAFPRATNVSEHRYTQGVDSLTLNHGSSVVIDEQRDADENSSITTLIATSPYAYHDGNANERLDETETIGRYPVVTVESVGEGRVIVVSDPSVFINSMLDTDGNHAFATNLVAAHDRVVLDVSHVSTLPPLTAALLDLRESAVVQLILGGLVVLGITRLDWLLATARRLLDRQEMRRSAPVDRDAIIAGVRDRHPDWDPERIERVTRGIMTAESKRTGDD